MKNVVKLMRGYLKKSITGTRIINKLYSPNLQDVTVFNWSGTSYYSAIENTIYLNPDEGNWIGPGQIQSPALIFFHECCHAFRNLVDPEGQRRDKLFRMDDTGDYEDYRVIIYLETRVAKQINRKLKKGPWEASRTKHKVPGIEVKGPTSREKK